ncbi:hypothetical protein BASA83_012260 [Batrachochytrium salamandrivorans]|nr:hypothetical protein BASA83_012260 [Batrachochytrium salamandrivorans]
MSFEYYRTTDSIARQRSATFYKSEIKYLGYIISADGLRMDPSKISAVQSWPTPKKVRDLQGKVFAGSERLPLLTRISLLIRMTPGRLYWRPMHRIMPYPVYSASTTDSNTLRPIAFYARQMNSAEQNYEIYDKELLAVVESFKHWRHFLQGGLHPVTVLCDHKNLGVLHDDQES